MSLATSNYPVVMYDCDNKKPVAIFCSASFASKYVFNSSVVNGSSVANRQVWKPNRNPYDVPITFRAANSDQRVELGGNDYVILDKNFSLKERDRKISIVRTLEGRTNPKNIFIHERNEKIKQLLLVGHTIDDVANMLKVTKGAILGYLSNSDVKFLINFNHGRYEVKDLQQLISVAKNRISLLSKTA